MEIRFEYDTESVRRSIEILRPFATEVPEGMHFRYPKEFLDGGDVALMVEDDERRYDASGMRDELDRFWREKKTFSGAP